LSLILKKEHTPVRYAFSLAHALFLGAIWHFETTSIERKKAHILWQDMSLFVFSSLKVYGFQSYTFNG